MIDRRHLSQPSPPRRVQRQSGDCSGRAAPAVTLCWVLTGLVFLSMAAGTAKAEEPVFLRGYEVSPQDVVFGSVDSLRGDVAIINLGYAHGMKSGLTLVAVRNVDGATIPVAGLRVLKTEPDHARARVEGPFRLEVGDFVLVHASRMDLWGGEPRLEKLAKKRIVRRQREPGYSTLDSSPKLIDEVARDDSFQGRQYISFERGTFVGKAAERVGPLESRLGAVSPLPVLDPSTATSEDEAEEAQRIAETDATILGLSRFVELADSADNLIRLMETDRLTRLKMQGARREVTENSAPLLRSVLIAWTHKAIRPGN